MPVKKEDWKTEPFPDSFVSLNFAKVLTEEEFQLVQMGLVPREMEDKWFIFFEEGWLYFHRSWTGHCIFKTKISEHNCAYNFTETFANRQTGQYNANDDEYDIRMLHFLIDRLLLSKNTPFPMPGHVPENEQPAFKHGIIGYGRSQNEN